MLSAAMAFPLHLLAQLPASASGLNALPGFWEAAAAAIAVALVLGLSGAKLLGLTRFRACLWWTALLLPTAATWTIPLGEDRTVSHLNFCILGVPPTPQMLFGNTPGEVTSNVAMLLPAGAAAMLWATGLPRIIALLLALAVSPAIEIMQLIPAVHRSCQMGDVINNSLGVLLGFCVASGLVELGRSLRVSGLFTQLASGTPTRTSPDSRYR